MDPMYASFDMDEPTLLRIFKVTGMDTMFHLYPSLDEALLAVPKPTQ